MTTAAATAAPVATMPVVRALLDKAAKQGPETGGVLGIRARPSWDGPAEFEHAGRSVVMAPCESALAVREALLEWGPGRWLVVLTDRDERDLGTGITAHLLGQRLRTPDPWDAVRDQFAATRIDHRLVSGPAAREIAAGLLAAAPPNRAWPPARGGLLTLDHAYGAVASSWFDLGNQTESVDVTAVLRWTTRSGQTANVAALRSTAGDAMTDAVLHWLAGRCGRAEPLVRRLLARGRVEDIVPLGVAARAVLGSPPSSGPWALLRREIEPEVTEDQVRVYVTASEAVARELLDDDQTAARVLARADVLTSSLEATAAADSSDLLRSGLTARLAMLGERLRQCAQHAQTKAAARGVDSALADNELMGDIETAWEWVMSHALARHHDETRVSRALAGVRLARWLAVDLPSGGRGLAGWLDRHRDEDAWVDRAYGDAWSGVGDEALAHGLRAVLEAVRIRRDAHDGAFAEALADHETRGAGLPPGRLAIEDLVSTVVIPLARQRPVLVVVADGMSTAVGTEVVDDVGGPYEPWQECLPDGQQRRLVAVAALPSLTHVSRTSLLTGTLAVGEQPAERDGFAALMTASRLTGRLFHKLTLDTTGAGFDLARDVAAAIDDLDGTSLVVCVLNTIDDALDRSDPGGTDWTADAVKHLVPLLERARRAGRVVVLTSDHGHVIERREGRMRSVGATSSNRSRPALAGPAAGEGEVRVAGRRVLVHDGDAILAVDERLRYGPLKAGYHGGAAPAEVVVPVHVLAPGVAPDGWVLAPPQSPEWWRTSVQVATPPPVLPTKPSEPPTLFDEAPAVSDLVGAVLGSTVYKGQRGRAVRATLKDDQVGSLLRALVAAPGNRIDPESAAAALGIAVVQLGGALSMVQRLLNVEQYPVLDRDPDRATIVLDVALLREQFGVG